MFATIDFGIAAPGLLHIAASLLQDIGRVKPAFEMPTTKLAFLVLFIASPLSRLLGLDLVLGELWRSLCARGYGCGQKVHPRSSGQRRRIPTLRILLEGFCALPETHELRRQYHTDSAGQCLGSGSQRTLRFKVFDTGSQPKVLSRGGRKERPQSAHRNTTETKLRHYLLQPPFSPIGSRRA